MALETFKLWTDAAMTNEFNWSGGAKKQFHADGDTVLYFGSPDNTKQCRGVGDTDIVVTPTDTGSDAHAITEIKIASTSAGLAGATPGAALNLGKIAAGGAGTAKAIHIRMTDSTGGLASTALQLLFNELEELAA